MEEQTSLDEEVVHQKVTAKRTWVKKAKLKTRWLN